MAKAAKPIPEGYHTVTPHLTLDNAARDDRVVQEGDSAPRKSAATLARTARSCTRSSRSATRVVMVNDVMPGRKDHRPTADRPRHLWLYVDNTDALFNHAVACRREGANAARRSVLGRSRRRRHRSGGLHWWIATRKEDLTHGRAGAARRRLLQADGAVRIPLTRHYRTARELFFPRGVSSFSDNSFTRRCCTSIRSFST